jgi:hypothetical protein
MLLGNKCAHLASKNTRSAKTEVSATCYNGDTHTGLGISANLGAEFLPIFGAQGGWLLPQEFCFFAEETIPR